MRHFKQTVCLTGLLLLLGLSACKKEVPQANQAEIQTGSTLPKTRFIQADGSVLDLNDFIGKKNVLLVIMRGFAGIICPYCTQQASELIQNRDKITASNTELIMVYPGPESKINDFVKAVNVRLDPTGKKMDIPLLLDVNLEAVKAMGLKADLSKPTTLILDKSGKVVFKFVGKDMKDRPDVSVILNELKKLQGNG